MKVFKWKDHYHYFGWTVGTLGSTQPIDKVSSNQYVSGIYTLTYVDSSQVGNTPIQLCPKGISDGSDVGDNSKDRILATNGVPSEESYFYRVD